MSEKWILIIDDAEAALQVFKKSLEEMSPDYHIITTVLINDAINHLKQQPFDLVITDDKIGEMNDLELLDSIQTFQPNTSILLMTSNRFSNGDGVSNPFMPYPSLPKPVDMVEFKKYVKDTIGDSPVSQPDFFVLSDERYNQVNQQLVKLKSDIGARCIFLTDAEGLVITRIGVVDKIPLEQIASLVAGSVATLLEAGRVIDGETETINLAYREGKHENLCVVNIGKKMLLIIVFGKGPYSSRLGTVWYFARRTARTLLEWINSFENTQPGQFFVNDMEEAVGSELDFIRKDLHTAALPPQNFDDIMNENTSDTRNSPFLSNSDFNFNPPPLDFADFKEGDIFTQDNQKQSE